MSTVLSILKYGIPALAFIGVVVFSMSFSRTDFASDEEIARQKRLIKRAGAVITIAQFILAGYLWYEISPSFGFVIACSAWALVCCFGHEDLWK